jgi:hypothetical protein
LTVLDEWTARSHGEAALAVAVSRGLNAALTEPHPEVPAWKARLERWLSASANAGPTLSKAIQGLLAPGAAEPAFAGVLGPSDEAAPAERRINLTAEGLPQGAVARAAVDDHRAEIEVRIDHFPRSERAPLLMLVPLTREGQSRILPLQRSSEGDYLYARFERVEPGEYIGYIEPLEVR